MFHSDGVVVHPRLDREGNQLVWGQLAPANTEIKVQGASYPTEEFAEGPQEDEAAMLLLLATSAEPGAGAAREHWAACR
jgi:hypothetical protein